MEIAVRTKKIEHCLYALESFSRSYYSFDAIYKHLGTLESSDGLSPYRHICNCLLSDATMSWCNVFGTDSEETHWKSVVYDENDFRNKLFNYIDISKEEYSSYWQDFCDFRNMIIAHTDINYFENAKTPKFDIALKSANFAYSYISKIFYL